ncbi:hypothetical protein O0L34_g17130 [Tuta absoluta]|nr:hypothetical protein O0L34_g17130 [Tuta absoluta]
MLGNHRFNMHSRCRGPRVQWLCVKWCSGCRASLFTYEGLPEFTESRRGRPMLVLGKYRYNQYYVNPGPATRWLCSRYSRKCRAAVYTLGTEIIRVKNNHNH